MSESGRGREGRGEAGAPEAQRVLVAVHHYPPTRQGGAEQRAARTAEALQRRGCDVRVVSVARIDRGQAGRVSWEDDCHQGIRVRRLSFNLVGARDRFELEYDNPAVAEHVRTVLAEWRPDVFHLIGGYLITAGPLREARTLGIPTVVTLTDFWWICPRITMLRRDGRLSAPPLDPSVCARCVAEEQRRFSVPAAWAPRLASACWRLATRRIRRMAERQATLKTELNGAGVVICPSQFLRAVHVEAGVRPDRLVYSRQGRDFPGLEAAQTAKTPSDRLRVGYLGQIAPLKGVHVLLGAMAQLQDVPIVASIHGDMEPFPDYARSLRSLSAGDPRVTYCGAFPAHDLSRVLRDLDLVVVPSLWYENSPNVILEAFAHRTPVVASDLGGMAELVEPGRNGVLFRAGSPSDLAATLRGLVGSPERMRALRDGIGPVRSVAEEIDELEDFYRLARRVSHGADPSEAHAAERTG